eukprot:TRINITY_DN4434_c0_g1_i2.p1 TRINITY_DN4434_c0_g1~~TRINITY_DN4434_c0_g1_i2.p1  ORF type:complete len:277 (-),score=59.52 TRINITY_DN4434_c0_g1_i2:39-869(-)
MHILKEHIHIAELDGQRAGFITFEASNATPFGVAYPSWGEPFVWVSFVFTAPAFRRRGVAQALYSMMESFTKQKQIKSVMLDVFNSNANSLKFHTGLGYAEMVGIYVKRLPAAAPLRATQEGLTVRPATLDDVEWVVDGQFDVYSYEPGTSMTEFDREVDRRDVGLHIHAGHITIAEINGKRAGFLNSQVSRATPFGVSYPDWSEPFVWYGYVYTEPEFRRRGVSEALYAHAEQKALAAGVRTVMLDVFTANTNSIAFHTRMGFQQMVGIFHKVLL